jgi:AcrR family transcriptional regulator
MRYAQDHAAETRRAILAAAGRQFRAGGYAGTGIDAIAAEAGVTSGAIYRQFGSKEALFAEVVRAGMERLENGLARLDGEGGIERIVSYYIGAGHVAQIADGCLLPTLSIDAGRSGDTARAAYAEGLGRTVTRLSGRPDDPETILLLATLIGGVVLARATGDETLRATLEATILARLAGVIPAS